MRAGPWISLTGHGALLLFAVFGLPPIGLREDDPVRVTEVSFISEAEFAAETSAPPAPVTEPPRAPEAAVPEPPAEIPDRIVSKAVVAPAPGAAAPRPQLPRAESPPTPEAMRPAALRSPTPPEPPVAIPAPDVVEASPPATLALQSSTPPMPRQAPPGEAGAESLLDALKREVAREVAAREGGTVASSLSGGGPLSPSETAGLKRAVQRCWSVPAGVRDGPLEVTLAVEFAADGAVIGGSIRSIGPRSSADGRRQQVIEAGRRALVGCSPYDLPPEKFARWRSLELVFGPEGVR